VVVPADSAVRVGSTVECVATYRDADGIDITADPRNAFFWDISLNPAFASIQARSGQPWIADLIGVQVGQIRVRCRGGSFAISGGEIELTVETADVHTVVAEANGPYSVETNAVLTPSSANSFDSTGSWQKRWDWGDGTNSGFVAANATPSKTYTTPGQRTLVLTIKSDVDGQEATDTAVVTVSDPAPTPPPSSGFNEPSGFSAIVEDNFTGDPSLASEQSAGRKTGMTIGKRTIWNYVSQLTRINDTTAPVSGPSVWKYVVPATSGVALDPVWNYWSEGSSSTNRQDKARLYFRIWIKLNQTYGDGKYQTHHQLQKLFYFSAGYTNTSNGSFVYLRGHKGATGPGFITNARILPALKFAALDSSGGAISGGAIEIDNAGAMPSYVQIIQHAVPSVAIGDWQLIEMEFKCNSLTSDAKDGYAKVWVNNTLVQEARNCRFRSQANPLGFHQFHFAFVNGGTQITTTRAESFEYDKFYVSVAN
jgi:hypothetical protein